MRTRLFILISLACNVALAWGFFHFNKRPLPPTPPTPVTVVSAPVATPGVVVEPISTNVVTFQVPFNWSQIAADDLKVYRDNLLAVGCPELTMREIIRAEINERFGPRRRAIFAGAQGEFWEALVRGELLRRQGIMSTPWGKQLEALALERRQLIASVLGPDYRVTQGESPGQEDLASQRDWLPAEKRGQLAALEQEHEKRMTDWAKRVAAKGGDQTDADAVALKRVQDEFEEQRKKLLSPEELEELRIRESSAADWAADLGGFEPTEDEWRTVARARLAFEEAQSEAGQSGLSQEDQTKLQNELASKLAENLKTLLGTERYAQYETASNSEYQQLRNVTQRFGLDESLARQAYDMQKAAQSSADKVRSDSSLTPEVRDATLKAIQQETERSLGGLLGAGTLTTYKQHGGEWIETMVEMDEALPPD
ncbi:MAG: hypothetical protein H7Y43_02690 [Akkermansiaceae bacterium]|nr:hypothetical protein [Verrucomicrobiales bacterium]